MRVPWLSKKTIEMAADGLLGHYRWKVARPVAPPIPVEDIIERGLGLNLTFTDLRARLQMPDVLGATFVDRKTICIDESLDQLAARGRLYFTCAHEAGHWVLHRRRVSEACRGNSTRSRILCRSKDAKKPLEWQADYFAACLLMPADEVKTAFNRLYGPEPIVLYNTKSAFCGPICYDPSVQTWPLIASGLIQHGGFSNVSKQAMIIRLQGLGLVCNETSAQLTWEASRGIA
jgi:hypothetical protein